MEMILVSTDIATELNGKFKPKKKLGIMLSESYKRLGIGFENKSFNTKHCGSFLEFRHNKLKSADFCRDRLCPLCAWRRTLKISGQVSKIVDFITPEYDFIFLTLTVPNCKGSDLPSVLTRMQHSFSKLRKRARFKGSIKGYFKSLEITHNLKKRSKSYNTYHPHFHIILAVDKNYFKSNQYISRDKWLNMWRDSYGDQSITQVDVRKCKPKSNSSKEKSLASAVVEVAKYAVKASSYLGEFDKKTGEFLKPYSNKIIDESVLTLNEALKYRRLVEMGGIFKEMHKKLNLDDCEDGDLVLTDNEEENTDNIDDDNFIYVYRWSFHDKCYFLFRRYIPDIIIDPETGEVLEE